MTWRAAWRRPQRWRDSGRSSHSRGREQAHGLAVPADDQPIAVMFYLMHPAGRCRRLGGKGGNAGIDVPVRTRGSYPDQVKVFGCSSGQTRARSSAVAPNGIVTLKIMPGRFFISARNPRDFVRSRNASSSVFQPARRASRRDRTPNLSLTSSEASPQTDKWYRIPCT
jgi:hypothetical protein